MALSWSAGPGRASRSARVWVTSAVPTPVWRLSRVRASTRSTEALAGPEHPPQFVQHDEVVPAGLEAGVGQGVLGGDGPEAFAPTGEQDGGLELVVGLVDLADVDADGGAQVDLHGRPLGEGLAQAPFAQRHDGQLHRVDGVAVALVVVAGQGHPPEGLGAVFEDRHQVGQYRVAGVVAVVEDLQGGRQDRFFGVAEGQAPVQGHEGGHQVEAPAVGVGCQFLAGPAAKAASSRHRRPWVQDVEGPCPRPSVTTLPPRAAMSSA